MFGRNGLFSAVAVCSVLALAASAQAALFDGVQIESWTGTGANSAVLVLDFGPAPDDSYAFGYRWDGSATSADMVLALDAAPNAPDFDTKDWGPSLGLGINKITYDGHVAESNWILTFLGYWLSTDGLNWSPAQTGVSGRALTNGSWDGFSVEPVNDLFEPVNAPVTPASAPEPMTLGLLLAGGVALLRRRA